MGRRPLEDLDKRLDHPLIVRLDKAGFERLQKLQVETGCHSIGEVVRRILSGRKLVLRHQDVSMDSVMEELVGIRKELKSIGVNINQLTRTFNQQKSNPNRDVYILKVGELYRNVGLKVDRLLVLVADLSVKWLQKFSRQH